MHLGFHGRTRVMVPVLRSLLARLRRPFLRSGQGFVGRSGERREAAVNEGQMGRRLSPQGGGRKAEAGAGAWRKGPLLNLGLKGPRSGGQIPLFVVGCQRSGTTMLLRVFEQSPECAVFHEGNSAAFEDSRIRGVDTIQRLIRESRNPVVVFKPLNDLQHTDTFLEVHLKAKAIWMYRQYQDVISSAVRKWGTAQRDLMYAIGRGVRRYREQAAISERMSPSVAALCRELCDDHMSSEDGAGLLWYVRNALYFDLSLHNDQRVLLVRYEDLVTSPEDQFQRVFDFIGCRFSREYIADIHRASIGAFPVPVMSPKIESLCEEMMSRLNRDMRWKDELTV